MKNPWFISGAVINNNLYFITEIDGVFMKMDLDSFKTTHIPLEKPIEYSQSAVIFADQEGVYVVINGGEYLLKYIPDEESWEYIFVNMKSKRLNCFGLVTKYMENLVFIPQYSNHIIYINTATGRVSEDILEASGYQEGELFFARADIEEGNEVWLFSNYTKEAIRYNVITRKQARYFLPDEIKGVMDAEIWQGYFYILDLKGNIVRWKTGHPVELIWKNIHGEKEYDFSILHMVGDSIWILPSTEGEEIISFNRITGKCKKQTMYPDGFGYYAPKVMGKYIHKIYTKKNCYLAMHAGTHMFCIDEKTGEGYWINILWPDDDEIMSNLVKRSRNLLQEHLVSLPEYLKYMEKENKEVSRKFGKVGQLIWKFCD